MTCPQCRSWTPGDNFYCPYCRLGTGQVHDHFSWPLACSATFAVLAAAMVRIQTLVAIRLK